MKKINSILLLIFVVSLLSCSKDKSNRVKDFSQYESLKSGFKDPQGTARPKVYWWWLNGNMDTVQMREELHAMKNTGIGGADIFEIGYRPDGVMKAGPAFMGDESIKSIVFAIREATKLNMEIGLNLSSSWNAGGTWITAQHSAKSLYFSKVTAKGGESIIKVPFPVIEKIDAKGKPRMIEFAADGKPVYRQEIAVLAVPAGMIKLDTAKIINVSKFFNAEKDELNWTAPAGDWEIHRFVCSSSGEQLKLPSPNSAGPIIDHFDSSATRVHFMFFINKLKPIFGDFTKTALKNLYLASFEATGTVWTPTLAGTFKKINGYDVDKFLPQLFNKEAFDSVSGNAFKRDFDLTLSELMINNHYRKGKEICNNYGLKLISESGGPGPPLHNVPVEGIKALGALDVPRGEFWIHHQRFDFTADSIDLLMLVKEVSAASHLYQRKITELEAFTSFQNWQEGPGDMRPIGDRAFMEGMSRVVVHGFTHSPRDAGYPGIGYVAGTHYNSKNTWSSKSKPFNDYLSRLSYVFQNTEYIADVLYYYGDRVPNFVTPKNTRFAVGSGYDYEVINTEKLLSDLTVKDGLLTLPYGAQFKVLALGAIHGKDPAVFKKIKELADQGAVITGPKTGYHIGESKEIADKLWADGKVVTTSAIDLLQSRKIGPDFDYTDKLSKLLDYQHKSSEPILDFIHYKKGDLDFYFVRNTHKILASRLCSFRQEGKTPELWDPVTGNIIPVPIYKEADGRIEIPITFAPFASYFIVFKVQSNGSHFTEAKSSEHPPLMDLTPEGDFQFFETGEYTLIKDSKEEKIKQEITSKTIDGAWIVSFRKEWGGPESATFPQLISWTTSADDGIKFYSGTAIYSKSFSYEASQGRVYLDLGKVAKVAEVWLNDKPLGITWTAPYRYEITNLVKAGDNTLKIEVVNTWSNRIVGDIGSKKRFTNSNLLERGSRELLWTETPLIDSGLLGPVTIEVINTIK